MFPKISHFKCQGILITKFNVCSDIVNWHIIYQKNNDNQVKLAELLFPIFLYEVILNKIFTENLGSSIAWNSS